MARPETARWTQDEIDILVDMTNYQLELEEQDSTMTISWTNHWRRVSSQLKEYGFNRSYTACSGLWHRGIEIQARNKEAAGPNWDDSEHEILVHMTKKQLSLEQRDPSSIISWAKHWKRVSLQLDESGYARTPENCEAYWLLAENGSGISSDMEAVEDNEADDGRQPTVHHDGVDSGKDAPPSQTSSNIHSSTWSSEEYENLAIILKTHRQVEENEGLEQLSGIKLWTEISQSHRDNGFDRTLEACKTFWDKEGRERSGFDERVKPSSANPSAKTDSNAEPSIKSSSNASKTPSLPPLWSPVNEVEESIVVSRKASANVLDEFGMNHTAGNPVSAPNPNSAPLKVKDPIATNPETVLYQDNQAQNKRGMSASSVTPAPSTTISERSSTPRFRFTPDQRAVLEAEVAKGHNVLSKRRTELAQQLGVDENSVRNWFNNWGAKARRSQGSSTASTNELTSTYMPIDLGFYGSEPRPRSTDNSAIGVTPTTSQKVSVDCNSNSSQTSSKRLFPEDGTSSQDRQSKRTCTETEVDGFSNLHDPNHVTGSSDAQHTSHSSSTMSPNRLNISQDGISPPTDSFFFSGDFADPANPSSNTPAEATSKISMEAKLPPSPQILKSTSQSGSSAEGQRTDPNVAYRSDQQPTAASYPQILCDNDNLRTSDQTNRQLDEVATNNETSNTSKINPVPNPKPASAVQAAIGSFDLPPVDQRNQLLNRPRSPTNNAITKNPSPGIETSPNREWVDQFTANKNENEKQRELPVNQQPGSTPLHSQSTHIAAPIMSQRHHSITNISQPTFTHTPSPIPLTANPAANERQESLTNSASRSRAADPVKDSAIPAPTHTFIPVDSPKATAFRTVQNFRLDVENLKQANSVSRTRIADLTQQISIFSDKRTVLDTARQAEITRVLQEIQKKYENECAILRQQAEWLESERDTEVSHCEKNAHELSKKENGLMRWERIVEYYEAEGE